MSTQVDDLKIKLEGDAKSAESQIDKIIGKLGQLEAKVSSVGNNNGIGKSFTAASVGIKKGITDLNQSISKINEIRKQVGELGKDYADKGGANLKTAAQIQKAIDNATAQMYKHQEKAALSGEGTKGFDSNIQQAIVLENHIASLQAKLDSINMGMAEASARRYEQSVANIDAAISRMNSKTEESETSTESLAESGHSVYKSYSDAEEQFNKLCQDMYGIGTAAQSSANKVATIQTSAVGAAGAVGNINQQFSMIGATIDAFKTKLANLPSFLERMNVIKPTDAFISIQNEIDKTETKLDKLHYQLDRGLATNKDFAKTTTFKKLQYDIQAAEDELKNLQDEMDNLGSRTHTLNLEDIGSKLRSSFQSALGVVKNVGAHLVGIASTINKKIVSGFTNFAKSLNKTDDVAKKLFKSFTRIGNMLKLMITRMALRGVINEMKQSFAELTQFSDKTAASFNKIRNAIKYLADTLVTLAAPILNASGTFRGLGNIIDVVTDKIVNLINKFNQLLSALLGHSTWIKATKQTKDYTKSVDKAGKAAKKALQPFDELNNLTSNDSGSGGADSGTGGSQFQELPIDPKWARIADWLKDMWKKADFTELGALLGAKLRDALNKIPWGKIQNAARRLASSLATLLNGFFRTPGLAKSIGNTIAGAINTGLIFAEEFIKKFDFAAFGKFIGESIVTAIKNIQWQRFIDACKNLGKGIATAINSLVNTGVISEIGKAIGKILLAAINFAFELVTNIDFDKLAEEIANGIKNFLGVLSAVDKETGLNGWEKIGKTISDALLGILKILNTTLGDKTILKQISDGITSMLNQIDFAEIIGQSAQLIFNIARGFATAIVAAFKSEEFRKGIITALPYVGAVFGAQLAGKGLLSIGSMIGKNLAKNIGMSLAVELPKLGASISGALSSVAAAIGTSVAAILGAIGLVIAAIVVWIKNWDAIKEAAGLFVERTQEHLEDLKAWFTTNMPYFSHLVSTAFEAIKSAVIKALEFIKVKLVNMKEGVVIGLGIVKDGFTRIVSGIVEDIKGKVESAKQHVKNGLELVRSLVEGFSEIITGVFNKSFLEIFQGFQNCFDSIKKYITELIGDAKGWGQKLVSNMKEGMENFGVLSFGGITNTIGKILHLNANGGIYVNHQWKPIQGYAGGGMPKSAEMFLARENGAPELVGTMGGHTAVANNDQIVASVSDGVYRAVMAAMANQNSNTNVNVELVGDTAKLFKAIRKEGSDYQRRTGNPVWA